MDEAGNELVAPAHLAQFAPSEWPGVSAYDSWWQWAAARSAWMIENDAPDDLLDVRAAMELQPVWTAADISRMV